MKSTYVATHLNPEDFRSLGIRAAESGTSKSAILRGLVEKFLAGKAEKSKGLQLRKGGKV